MGRCVVRIDLQGQFGAVFDFFEAPTRQGDFAQSDMRLRQARVDFERGEIIGDAPVFFVVVVLFTEQVCGGDAGGPVGAVESRVGDLQHFVEHVLRAGGDGSVG